MKRFSFDWETVGMGAGTGRVPDGDGAEHETRLTAAYVQTWAIRDNQLAQVIATCHDALTAGMVVDSLNARVEYLRDPSVTQLAYENTQPTEMKAEFEPKGSDF